MRATSHRFLFICEQRHSVGKGWSKEGKALFDCLPWMISSRKQRQVIFTITSFCRFFMTDKKRKMILSSIHNMDMILKRRKLTLLLPGMFTIIVLPLTPAAGLENKNRRIYVDL